MGIMKPGGGCRPIALLFGLFFVFFGVEALAATSGSTTTTTGTTGTGSQTSGTTTTEKPAVKISPANPDKTLSGTNVPVFRDPAKSLQSFSYQPADVSSSLTSYSDLQALVADVNKECDAVIAKNDPSVTLCYKILQVKAGSITTTGTTLCPNGWQFQTSTTGTLRFAPGQNYSQSPGYYPYDQKQNLTESQKNAYQKYLYTCSAATQTTKYTCTHAWYRVSKTGTQVYTDRVGPDQDVGLVPNWIDGHSDWRDGKPHTYECDESNANNVPFVINKYRVLQFYCHLAGGGSACDCSCSGANTRDSEDWGGCWKCDVASGAYRDTKWVFEGESTKQVYTCSRGAGYYPRFVLDNNDAQNGISLPNEQADPTMGSTVSICAKKVFRK